MSTQPTVSVSNLTCGHQSPLFKVERLDIYPGEFVALLGPSGIGKSTFLETLGLMSNAIWGREGQIQLRPTGTSEVVDLHEMWTTKTNKLRAKVRARHLSFIFQDNNLLPHLSILENVTLPLLYKGVPQDVANARALKLFEKLNLDAEAPDKLPHAISGGQRQRVAFARAAADNFTLLLADEPTGNLDPENARALLGQLKVILKTQGSTAFIVTHDHGLAQMFADRILHLHPSPHGPSILIEPQLFPAP